MLRPSNAHPCATAQQSAERAEGAEEVVGVEGGKDIFGINCLNAQIRFYTFFLLSAIVALGQNQDTLQKLKLSEVIVTAFKEEPARFTPLNITSIRVDSLSRQGNYNLAEMLAKQPGVTMLTTGVAIAKPVIRGLYGNRVLVLLSGLKFDNQQWQEEHGLGLSGVGLQKVELIKGPMSVLYGTEAIGGLINLIEEQKPADDKESDLSIKLNSNTLGGLIQYGLRKNLDTKWYGLRIGAENNADYTDGSGDRVLNSRFDGYYLKASYGFQKKNWTSTNHFMSSFNRFGFIFNDVYDFIEPDQRWSRKLNDFPAHFVLLNVFSSENKYYLQDQAKLTIDAGVQSNLRMENEGSGRISLNMHLLTVQYLAKWEKEISEDHRLIISNLGSFEDNTNYGARKIVPDANMQESNLSVYYEIESNDRFVFENGLSAGEKWVKTYFTPSINGPDKELDPFNKFEPYWNVFSGFSFYPNQHVNFKLNVSTGVRIPNLAELSSDGLHEGIFTYEIGDPELKNEQIIAFNALLNYSAGIIEISLTPFYNIFNNYVYLAPTTEEWFGFPIFRYRQQDAKQYGTEASIAITTSNKVHLEVGYSGMVSKTDDGNYTPFTPAQKIKPAISFPIGQSMSAFADLEYNLMQDKVYPDEIRTPAYTLVNAGLNWTIHGQKRKYDLSLSGHNLLNEVYFDHLSRFKYFGLNNIGRNISLFLKVTF